jgi:uncharacterized YigZ family protein
MTSFLSIAERFRFEPEKIKGSRHIATLAPISDEAAVAVLLDELRAEFPDANHHAYAWRLGRRGERFYYSDDGEPSGSAGRPILQHLEGRDVTNLILVVSRIFGGTKLGVGGLVRAYGGAARAVLDAVSIVEVIPKIKIEVEFPYGCSNAIQALLHTRDIQTLSADYGEQVTMVLEVIESEVEDIEREIRDGTSDVATVSRL